MGPEDCWRTIALSQYGLITSEQLKDCGKSRRAVQRLVARGGLERDLPGVLRMPTPTPSWQRPILAACLWAGHGAVASHRSAAALLELPGGNRKIIEISSGRHLANAEVVTHQARIDQEDVEPIGPIPATSPLRTLADLGAVCSQPIVEDAIDEALRKRLVTAAELRVHAASLNVKAWGSRSFPKAVADVDVRLMLTESVFESRLFRVLTRAGLPLPVPQFVVRRGGKPIARVDFAYPEARLAIEAESLRWHRGVGRHRHEYNLERQNRLSDIDWTVILVGWEQLKHRPDEIIRRVREFLYPNFAV